MFSLKVCEFFISKRKNNAPSLFKEILILIIYGGLSYDHTSPKKRTTLLRWRVSFIWNIVVLVVVVKVYKMCNVIHIKANLRTVSFPNPYQISEVNVTGL